MYHFISVNIIFCSCNEKQKAAEPAQNPLYEEVMAIHDQVMPEMTTIHNLKKDLKALEKPETKIYYLGSGQRTQ